MDKVVVYVDNMMNIYDLVKSKLGDVYANVFYQTMRADKHGDVGIYLYQGQDDLEDMCGNAVYNCIKIHVQINSEKGNDGLSKALQYLSDFTYRIEKEQSDMDNIQIISAKHLGPRAVPIGKNEFGILICKCDIDLKYVFI